MENKGENHMISAAAFVEGGIQESCDDACSICLEEFSDSEPSTITVCRHEFHLQCVLEWGQRSSQCPMCWQQISLKDPTGQELFEAVEQERKWSVAPSRNVDIFNYHNLRDFGLQRRLRMGVHDANFEDQILQNFVASMGRTHHISNQYVANSPNFGSASERRDGSNAICMGSQSTPITSNVDEPSQQTAQILTESSSTTSESTITETNCQENHSNDSYASTSSPRNQDKSKPSESESPSFSDTLRSKLGAMSMRYKESISKGWKKRLFSRSSSMSELGSNVRKEAKTKMTSVTQSMEFNEARENNRIMDTSAASSTSSHSN